MTSRISREWLLASAGLLIAFIGLTAWVRFQGPVPGDERVLRWATAHPTNDPNVSGVYQLFGSLGTRYVALAATIAAALVVLANIGAAEAGLVLAGAAVALLEPFVMRLAAPTKAALVLGVPEGGYPSGHVLFATGAFGTVAWMGHRHGRPEVTLIAVALVVLMGVSRVLDRSHVVSDVLAGYLLGGAWLCLLVGVANRFTDAR